MPKLTVSPVRSLSITARRLGVYEAIEPLYGRVKATQWRRAGKPLPPPGTVKRRTLVEVAQRHGLDVLVETGTLYGDTVRMLRSDFQDIYSIELLPELYEKARHRCRTQKNAHLLLGDSGLLLPELAAQLSRPALFWLDAHYSGPGTAEAVEGEAAPIERELTAIFASSLPHVVLIDDAREFHASEQTGYPSSALIANLAEQSGYTFSETNDAFYLVPANG